MKYRIDFVTNSSSTNFVPAVLESVGAIAAVLALGSALPAVIMGSAAPVVASAAPVPGEVMDAGNPDETRSEQEKKDDKTRRRMQTAVMPVGQRTVVPGSGEPLWLYAQMLTASTPEAEFAPDTDLTEGISFRVVEGGSAVTLGEKQIAGEWVAVPVFVSIPTAGDLLPETIRIAAERITGARYFRKTLALDIAGA